MVPTSKREAPFGAIPDLIFAQRVGRLLVLGLHGFVIWSRQKPRFSENRAVNIKCNIAYIQFEFRSREVPFRVRSSHEIGGRIEHHTGALLCFPYSRWAKKYANAGFSLHESQMFAQMLILSNWKEFFALPRDFQQRLYLTLTLLYLAFYECIWLGGIFFCGFMAMRKLYMDQS